MALNVFQKKELKSVIDQLAEAYDNAGKNLGLDEGAGDAVKMEMAMFMMYLSASDGEIKWEEANLIRDLCDISLTPQQMGEFIRERNIYSTEFEKKVPVTFQLIVTIDDALFSADTNSSDGIDAVLQLYRLIGKALIDADDDVDYNEKQDYEIYINMLEKYANENSKRRCNGAFGFKKDTKSVDAPTKSGVSAPHRR